MTIYFPHDIPSEDMMGIIAYAWKENLSANDLDKIVKDVCKQLPELVYDEGRLPQIEFLAAFMDLKALEEALITLVNRKPKCNSPDASTTSSASPPTPSASPAASP